jgi:transcriptional regulator with XRE-family HTH domain
VDPIRFGRGIRALRRRRRWRQVDLGVAARLSRSAVSRIERGHIDEVTLRSVDAIAGALGARIDLRLSWNGEALDRLLDADHALLVEEMAGRLRRLGWQVAVEASFNVFGERGSIDVLGFHEPTRIALVIEVKSVVPDLQAAIVSLDRKARLAVRVSTDRGWPATSAGRLLVLPADRTTRRRVDQHAEIFRAAFPARSSQVSSWLADPRRAAFSGLLFVSGARHASARHRVPGPGAGDRAGPASGERPNTVR